MQKIMIVSDTHREHSHLRAALQKEQPDLLLHCGDVEGEEETVRALAGCKVIFVPGNCDYEVDYPAEQEFELGSYRVFMTHGHYYYVSLDLQTIEEEGRARNANLVLFGHTHRPVISELDDMTLINPGSISYPRQNDHHYTYIIMNMKGNGKATFSLRSVL